MLSTSAAATAGTPASLPESPQLHDLMEPQQALTDSYAEVQLIDTFGQAVHLDPWQIDVRVQYGVAHLEGTVDSRFEKWRAHDLALQTPGVHQVHDTLAVKGVPWEQPPHATYELWTLPDLTRLGVTPRPQETRHEQLLRSEIVSKLVASPFVDASGIDVNVDDGVAELDGVVTTDQERLVAVRRAFSSGATWVEDNLEVLRN